jgi:hypothetical protein
MVVVYMSLMPPKVIKREVYLQIKGLFGYQMILDLKGAQTFEERRS